MAVMFGYFPQNTAGIAHRHHTGRNVPGHHTAGVVILPGVTVGDNTVIGAGSVVTKDIPSGVVAVGNPCRVLREVGEQDRNYYYRNMPVDKALFDAAE